MFSGIDSDMFDVILNIIIIIILPKPCYSQGLLLILR